MPSICLVAGDPSGDAHAARLIEALKRRDPSLTFSGLGGQAMQRAGCALLDDLTAAAAIGPFDAARHLGRFTRAKRLLDAHLRAHRPDLVILVDFGDFNLPVIAPLVKRHNIPIVYYISPQLWAWGRWRLRYVQRYVNRMIVFFPFEEALYKAAGVAVTWVGHPLLESAHPTMGKDEAVKRFGLNPWRMTVGLLPGSRTDEVRRHLRLMMAAARRIAWHMPGIQFLLPRAPTVPASMIEPLLAHAPVDIRLAEGSVYDALQCMDAAVVASGTATLEAALSGVPMVVVYRTSWPTYLAAKLVLRIPNIALVNVVAERRIVPELVQHQATPARVAKTIVDLLRNQERCEEMRKELRAVGTKLGEPARPGSSEGRAGGAVDRAAAAVLELLATRDLARSRT